MVASLSLWQSILLGFVVLIGIAILIEMLIKRKRPRRSYAEQFLGNDVNDGRRNMHAHRGYPLGGEGQSHPEADGAPEQQHGTFVLALCGSVMRPFDNRKGDLGHWK